MGASLKQDYFGRRGYEKPVQIALFINTLWGMLLAFCISLMVFGITLACVAYVHTPLITEPYCTLMFLVGLAGIITLVVLRKNSSFPGIDAANSGYYTFRNDIKRHAQHVLSAEDFDTLWHQKEDIPSGLWLDREVEDGE